MMFARLLHSLFHGPAWLAFIVMGIAAGGITVCSLHLSEMFMANFELIRSYGTMALADGGLMQLLELVFWSYLGLACYFVFKGCLDGLLIRVHRLGQRDMDRH